MHSVPRAAHARAFRPCGDSSYQPPRSPDATFDEFEIWDELGLTFPASYQELVKRFVWIQLLDGVCGDDPLIVIDKTFWATWQTLGLARADVQQALDELAEDQRLRYQIAKLFGPQSPALACIYVDDTH